VLELTGYTIYNIQYTIYNLQYTIYNIQYTTYNIQYTIYNIQYTIYNIQYTTYNIQYTYKTFNNFTFQLWKSPFLNALKFRGFLCLNWGIFSGKNFLTLTRRKPSLELCELLKNIGLDRFSRFTFFFLIETDNICI